MGCGQPELIDRTQPNYIKKSELLEGTWYIQESVVDVPKTPSGVATIGYGGKIEKIRFEVQEDLLVAYRTYEIVPGVDPRVDREKSKLGNIVFKDGRPYKGNPVFAYQITSHFDRQREYNAATGEQSNVLVEDTADRPWYEREYMRVDWRNSQIMNFDELLQPQPRQQPVWAARTGRASTCARSPSRTAPAGSGARRSAATAKASSPTSTGPPR